MVSLIRPLHDLHRHLGGSLSSNFIHQTLLADGHATSLDDVLARMTFKNGYAKDFHDFLDKFRILDEIRWNPPLIRDSINCICDELENEGVEKCWLDFSVNKYTNYLDWSKIELIELVCDCFENRLPGRVGLVLALKYETLETDYDQDYLELLKSSLIGRLTGVDLVGDETKLNKDLCVRALKPWLAKNKMVRMHVAEVGDVSNARFAIEDAHVTNVAHGIKITDDPQLVKLALARDVTFDLALTSNYVTGIIARDTKHPVFGMLEAGLKVTINSDDPIQLQCDLKSEFDLAKRMGFTDEQIRLCQRTAIESVERFGPSI